jgi:hypothetical protein
MKYLIVVVLLAALSSSVFASITSPPIGFSVMNAPLSTLGKSNAGGGNTGGFLYAINSSGDLFSYDSSDDLFAYRN